MPNIHERQGSTSTIPASPTQAGRSRLVHITSNSDTERDSDDGLGSDEEVFRPRAPSLISVQSSDGTPTHPSIRIFDNSQQTDDSSLAKDARIRGRHTVGSQASGYIVYDCEIVIVTGVKVRTLKRYSAFVHLKEELCTAYPQLCESLPKLPPKSSLAKFRPSFLDRRQKQLDLWLRTLLLHPTELSTCNITRRWILE